MDITVPGRFAPILQRNYDQSNAASNAQEGLAAAFSHLQSNSIGATAQQLRERITRVQAVQADVARLLQGQSCTGPIRQQFEEMLYHYVVPQDPGQHATLRFADAVSISDAVYRPGEATNLKVACLADINFPQDAKTIAWCDCVSKAITGMTPDRVARYTKRYQQFDRDMQAANTALQRGQDHPDIRLFGTYRNCAR